MIDFKTSPRGSGKTTEIIEMYNVNPGIIFVRNLGEALRFKITCTCKIPEHSVKKYLEFDRSLIEYKWLYFDEFFSQNQISYKDIIDLDKAGFNIVIRGTPVTTSEPSDEFWEYLKENYPETILKF